MKELKKNQYFFEHEQMDFEVQIALGGCYYRGGDSGEVLATAKRIKDGVFESWYREWYAVAERVRGIADASAAAGRRVSARDAFLRAAAFYALANVMVDGTEDPSRLVPTWKQNRSCWDEFCALLDPPAERFDVPYEDTPMPGYFFRPEGPDKPRATIIFNNGSDGVTSGMWTSGIAAALERGYAAFTFDGPGQNAMLWLHNVPFRHDWEKVITPVVDCLIARNDVDPDRIVLSGISQAGYWVPRALAFEHRIAAGIADPGVMDVSTSWFRNLPKPMIELIDAGEEKTFNQIMTTELKSAPAAVRQGIEFRMKPYCNDNYCQVFKEVRRYNLRDVIKQVKCPVFISDPDDEQFWPGQSQEVYDALDCPKTIVQFTAAEGANLHCEPQARSLYDQRMFDWLASVVPARQ